MTEIVAAPSPAEKRFTPTERRIIAYVAEHEGKRCTKADIARALGRHQKTIDRLMTDLRTRGDRRVRAFVGPRRRPARQHVSSGARGRRPLGPARGNLRAP